MHRYRSSAYRELALSEILTKMAEGATIAVPAPMVERLLDDYIKRFRANLIEEGDSAEAFFRRTGVTEEDVRNSQRETAAMRLRNGLLLRKIAELEGITGDDAEVDEAVERLASVASEMDNPRRFEAVVRSDEIREMLEDEMFDRKLWERLVEIATEGQGAVINPWTPPAAQAEETTPADEAAPEDATTVAVVSAAPAEDAESPESPESPESSEASTVE
jgi:trigger factor